MSTVQEWWGDLGMNVASGIGDFFIGVADKLHELAAGIQVSEEELDKLPWEIVKTPRFSVDDNDDLCYTVEKKIRLGKGENLIEDIGHGIANAIADLTDKIENLTDKVWDATLRG